MKSLILLLTIWVCLASHLFADITLNAGNNGGCSTSSTSVTFSLTVNTGSDRLVIIGVNALDTVGTGGNVMSVVFNGTETATAIGSQVVYSGFPGANYIHVNLYQLVAPTETTANVVATFDTTASVLCAAAIVLNGVNQSGAVRTPAGDIGGSGTTPSLTITSQNNDWVLDNVASWNYNITGPDAGQTKRAESASSTTFGIAMSTETATSATTTMGWTAGASDWHAYAGVAVIPSSVTGRSTVFGDVLRVIN